jgi:hypothetical protein
VHAAGLNPTDFADAVRDVDAVLEMIGGEGARARRLWHSL